MIGGKTSNKNRIIAVVVLLLATALLLWKTYEIEKENAYYRNFYRTKIEITTPYRRAFKTVRDAVILGGFDQEEYIAFFQSETYQQAIEQMQNLLVQLDELYAQYPIKDFSTLTLYTENLQHIIEYADWVLSDEFELMYAESSFIMSGLKTDYTPGLEVTEVLMQDPRFPTGYL